jgi:epoxyqueuosine reductase QueG
MEAREGEGMTRHETELADTISRRVEKTVAEAETVTRYRKPLVGFAAADNPAFAELKSLAEPTHMLPDDLLAGARSVVSFFLPFAEEVVYANGRSRTKVPKEWALAYVETNRLIGKVTEVLAGLFAERGFLAAGEPATYNFDPESLVSRWSHKSVAAIAGLGSFGLHRMVITDAGCAGRFGSLVTDAELPAGTSKKERCLFFYDGSCFECVERCPTGALQEEGEIDRQKCWNRCLAVGKQYEALGQAESCGKCAIGVCAFESAV